MSDCEDHVYETAGEGRGGYETTYCGKNLYRTEIGRSGPEPGFKAFPLPLTKNVKAHGDQPAKKKSLRCRLIIAIAVAIAIIIAFLVALIVQMNVSLPEQGENTSTNFNGPGENELTTTEIDVTRTPETTANSRSCLAIKNQGTTDDGIYDVNPDDNFGRSQTYCDMTTDGGGWTLVASIHESNITKKCHPDDLWSVYQRTSANDFPAQSNWENKMIFGNVRRATTADFKHVGFFAMKASDIMVWHVPNSVTTAQWKEQSTLRYRTNNKFLEYNGGSVGAIYKDEYPLTISAEHNFTSIVLDALSLKGPDITKIFPDFHNYTYGQTVPYLVRIPDADMYRPTYYGNLVSFIARECRFSIVDYGTNHKCPGFPTIFGTRRSKPFFAVAAIINVDRKTPEYSIRLNSYRPYYYRDDETVFHNETVTKGNLKLQYKMVQYRYQTYVTVGEFYFVVSSEKDWGSIKPSKFYWSDGTKTDSYRINVYSVEGSPTNIVFGYTLLAISSGGAISQEQANKVGEEILNAIAPLKNLFADIGPPGLVTPVVFDKGSTAEVMDMVPPKMRPYSEPGYLQFRAYNASGYPSAFCPGIKVSSLYPEYSCVGSISNSLGDHGTCGDYAGWEGLSTDGIQTNDTYEFAHSYENIDSTILIFQR